MAAVHVHSRHFHVHAGSVQDYEGPNSDGVNCVFQMMHFGLKLMMNFVLKKVVGFEF